MPDVLIVMGSRSDSDLADACCEVLKEEGIEYECIVSSAHRDPDRTRDIAITAEERGVKVIIAIAGFSAHLPGVIASYTRLPVIGVPVDSSPLKGVDALYSIVQMPSGVPVACMGIGRSGAKNAAHLAVRVLSLLNR